MFPPLETQANSGELEVSLFGNGSWVNSPVSEDKTGKSQAARMMWELLIDWWGDGSTGVGPEELMSSG